MDVRELQQGTRTGIGRVVEAFIAEAPHLDPDARLFLYADKTTRSDLQGERTEVRILRQPAAIWFDQVALPMALAKDRIDVFFSPYYKAPVAAPCPAVVTIHDILFLKFGGQRIKKALFKPWIKFIASRVARVLTDSDHSRRDLENSLGFDSADIEVIPLGVSPSFSPSARAGSETLAETLGFSKNYILSITNFLAHKNDECLVRAFAELAPQEPSLTLVMAGRAAAPTRHLKALVKRLGLEERVAMPGLIADKDLPALYAGARVFAFPSLYEGFGLPVLEALASGVPVACSSATSLPEVTSDAALLLEPTDPSDWAEGIRRLLSDEPLRKTLIEAGRARASQFSWRNSAARILSVLEEVSKK